MIPKPDMGILYCIYMVLMIKIILIGRSWRESVLAGSRVFKIHKKIYRVHRPIAKLCSGCLSSHTSRLPNPEQGGNEPNKISMHHGHDQVISVLKFGLLDKVIHFILCW